MVTVLLLHKRDGDRRAQSLSWPVPPHTIPIAIKHTARPFVGAIFPRCHYWGPLHFRRQGIGNGIMCHGHTHWSLDMLTLHPIKCSCVQQKQPVWNPWHVKWVTCLFRSWDCVGRTFAKTLFSEEYMAKSLWYAVQSYLSTSKKSRFCENLEVFIKCLRAELWIRMVSSSTTYPVGHGWWWHHSPPTNPTKSWA